MTGRTIPTIGKLDEELSQMAMDNAILDLQASGKELNAAWENFVAGNVPAEIHEDAPLKVWEAVCLPELGGTFTVAPAFRVASPTITEKTLRNAFKHGLRPARFDGKNIYVTRRAIKEWQEGWRDQENQHSLSSGRSVVTNKVGSRTSPSTTSTMTTSSTSLDAARMILQELREHSSSISSKSTRKK